MATWFEKLQIYACAVNCGIHCIHMLSDNSACLLYGGLFTAISQLVAKLDSLCFLLKL